MMTTPAEKDWADLAALANPNWNSIYSLDNNGAITMRCAHCGTVQFGRINDLERVCPYCKGTGVKDIGDIL